MMSTAVRLRVGLSATLREFVREPLNVALLVVLPPVVITSYGSMMGAFPRLPYMDAAPETLGALNGTLFVATFLPGVIGLFQVISARSADERLAVCGFQRSILFTSRLLAVVAASLLTAAVSLAVLTTRTDVADPAVGFAVLAFVGVLYGLVGMLVGAVLPRELEGSLVLIFLADVDELMASGLFQSDSVLVELLPMHYPHGLFQSAVAGEALASGNVVASLGYAAVLFALALGVYTLVTGEGGVLG
jgi:ABC-2 type transport system permease protein